MTDAPERIWAKIHGASTDVMSGQRGLLGAWHECQRDGHTAYVRADLVEAMEAENQRLREALSWYGEQARLARLIHSEGDAGRRNLEADGGTRARATLRSTEEG